MAERPLLCTVDFRRNEKWGSLDAPKSLIPAKQYRAILEAMPVVCVDLIVRHGSRFLLVKRKNEPLKDEWWVPGGRIFKGEMALEAAYRKLQEETGVKPSRGFRFVGYYEDFYDNSAFEVPCHTLSLLYETEVDSKEVKLDEHSEDFKWDWGLPMRLRITLKA